MLSWMYFASCARVIWKRFYLKVKVLLRWLGEGDLCFLCTWWSCCDFLQLKSLWLSSLFNIKHSWTYQFNNDSYIGYTAKHHRPILIFPIYHFHVFRLPCQPWDMVTYLRGPTLAVFLWWHSSLEGWPYSLLIPPMSMSSIGAGLRTQADMSVLIVKSKYSDMFSPALTLSRNLGLGDICRAWATSGLSRIP